MSTIRDVAREASVSVATVSRVLNNPDTVRDDTRQRVEQAMQVLRYRPTLSARSLSRGTTSTISAVMPFLTRPSYVERLRAVEAVLGAEHYDLVVSNIEAEARWQRYLTGVTQERRYDGSLFITLVPDDESLEQLLQARVPVVLIDASHPELPSVDIDDHYGGQLAADHLLARGHRRIAFMGDHDPRVRLMASVERLDGFAWYLDQAGYPLAAHDSHIIPHNRRAARDLTESLLDRLPSQRPTALFATSDTTALGALDALRQRGLRAPDDLAVIGFDDLDVAELYDLTTIRQPLYDSGALGVQALLSQIATGDPPDPFHRQLPLTLIPRGTT